jgi:phenylpropionate dioxygenase-like ring-hydroxylating dioxygenase large terminal subunit
VLFDEPVVAVRQIDGRIEVMSNVCRHRASTLLEGKGRLEGSTITCPYHGWAYHADGRLKGAPAMGTSKGFEPSKCRQPTFRHEVWQGFVFINFDADADALAPQLAPLDEIFDAYGFADFLVEPVSVLDGEWNWKATLENFSEAYHQPKVHPQTAEPINPSGEVIYSDNNGGPFSHFWMPTVPVDGVYGPPGLPSNPDLKGLMQETHALVVNIFPYLHIIFDPSSALILDWDISGVDQHRGLWSMAVPPATQVLPAYEIGREATAEFFHVIAAEDVAILQRVAIGLKSSHYVPGRLNIQEKAVHQLHNWLMDQYQGLSKKDGKEQCA